MGRRILLALVLCLGTVSAHAADYYWEIGSVQAATPEALCTLAAANYPNVVSHSASAPFVSGSEISAYCYVNQSTGNQYRLQMYRRGTSCPAGTTYNTQTGACDAPQPDKCESTKGQVIYHGQKIADIQDGHLSNYAEPPASMCSGSCTYNSPAEFADAYRFKNGDPAGVWQNYSYLGTGESCTASTSSPEPSTPSERNPTGEKTTTCTNKVPLYGESIDGGYKYDCRAFESKTEPGNLKCASGENGKTVCVTGKPSPSKKDTEIKTEVKEEPASDGSSTTTTTTTTTVTSCTGVDACTTTTTVNNSTSGTKADGTPGDTSSSCSGPGCQEGESDDGEDEEDQPERTASGDTDCDAPLACDGDAIDCAVLRQQKQLRCEVKDQGDFPKHKDEVKGLLGNGQFAQEEDGQVEAPSFLNQGSRFLPATCPTAKSFSLKTNGGRTFQLSYEPLCAAASDLGILFVIGTSVFCALYVGRAFGGE
ncbi:virulence factor TspB C-terminal domain-related protein [Pseudomonas sp. QL9]|uniref:virulence factor TspB C-terminal domain-related protein n=1 Tax=Pseudomonas sp. QL9 TaxID=3242725 RepID=UPI00352BBDFD